ncbi:Uma2 family endonuclease [Alienimonas chondri]|uniref:Putative restriction endonuclease domain-containing protein n=1 Tax=Alienimonas chondri TaxID=2681879 RepID=A0ABX1VFD4_9PLAN|nr:Uma2 family endonuclease [Alienimonas chondri]NNJ26802.1 hypothetical protein [Alienimonas chondri]
MTALLDTPPADRVGSLSRAALAARFGGIDPQRVLLDPPPGTATVEDMECARRETGRLCEILDGTLVEKAVSWFASQVAMELARLLGNWLDAHRGPNGRRLGYVAGPDGFFHLEGEPMVTPRLRAPDVSYVSRTRFPDGRFPRTGYPTLAPNLVVEILSPGNTAGEMRQKRANFFAAGTVRVWQIDPLTESAEMFDPAAADESIAVPVGGTLDAGEALPGFAMKLTDLFTDDLRDAASVA